MKITRKLLIAGGAMVPILGAGGLAYASTAGAAGGPGAPSVTTPAPSTGLDAPDPAEAAATPPETDTESRADGRGGHQDPTGSNVDHQFQGQE